MDRDTRRAVWTVMTETKTRGKKYGQRQIQIQRRQTRFKGNRFKVSDEERA